MKVFFTKTYNMGGSNAKKQEIIEVTARKMGFEEISFFKFPDMYDSDDELNVRMEGILAAMEDEAIVIFQYPSMVSMRYDKCAIEHIKRYRNIKLIIMMEDLGSVICPEEYSNLNQEITLFNQADLLILPSIMMKEHLIDAGLHNIPVIYQEVWDYPYEICNNDVVIKNKLQNITDISIYAMIAMKQAGIGIEKDFDNSYLNMCNPLETGFCICAGIPMLAKTGSRLGQFISTYQTGFVVEHPEDPEQVALQIPEKLINEKIINIRTLQGAISSGFFTKTLLQQAVYRVFVNQFMDKTEN